MAILGKGDASRAARSAVRALRVLSAERRGSSWPVLVETTHGRLLAKLRGAAQGPGALVAEVIVAELAAAIGLRVPRWIPASLDDALASDDRDAELADLLAASHGLNLGFEIVDGARDLRPDDVERIDADTASRIVWLDGLVQNPDRGARNPNLLVRGSEVWLIDHGAALGFHHDWPRVTEAAPRRRSAAAGHVLERRATRVAAWDETLASLLPRDVLDSAVAAVPDELLVPLIADPAAPRALERRRAAYAAFLWKRLAAPRPFVAAAPPR